MAGRQQMAAKLSLAAGPVWVGYCSSHRAKSGMVSRRDNWQVDTMTDLRNELAAAQRSKLLRYLASAIHGFTIMARDPDVPVVEKDRINNTIHYLAGHLMALTEADEPLTGSRLDAIVELVRPLNSLLAQRSRERLSL